MKLVKLKTQMILLFIPFVNIAVAYIWFYVNLPRMFPETRWKEHIKSFFFSCLACVLVIPFILVVLLLPKAPEIFVICTLIMFYVLSTAVMSLLIYYQKIKGVP